MKIKICGIFREEDTDYINQARPDYTGFVFAKSKREVSHAQAADLKKRLADGIITVGVFVDSPIADIIDLYRGGVISIAQLHGSENEEYIDRLKEESAINMFEPIQIIKALRMQEAKLDKEYPKTISSKADFYLIDSTAGSGKTFDWNILNDETSYASRITTMKPWFLAGGINTDNILQAAAFNPFCIDISGGAETNGVKDCEKIIQLVTTVRKGNEL